MTKSHKPPTNTYNKRQKTKQPEIYNIHKKITNIKQPPKNKTADQILIIFS